ncbi:MAG TPA: hypothetical protein VMW48_06640 [Vicinamibacterales bacterium]|nr:hypothetical protein [Vicinamibacterales bacterium]
MQDDHADTTPKLSAEAEPGRPLDGSMVSDADLDAILAAVHGRARGLLMAEGDRFMESTTSSIAERLASCGQAARHAAFHLKQELDEGIDPDLTDEAEAVLVPIVNVVVVAVQTVARLLTQYAATPNEADGSIDADVATALFYKMTAGEDGRTPAPAVEFTAGCDDGIPMLRLRPGAVDEATLRAAYSAAVAAGYDVALVAEPPEHPWPTVAAGLASLRPPASDGMDSEGLWEVCPAGDRYLVAGFDPDRPAALVCRMANDTRAEWRPVAMMDDVRCRKLRGLAGLVAGAVRGTVATHPKDPLK